MSNKYDPWPTKLEKDEFCILCGSRFTAHVGYCCPEHERKYMQSDVIDITKLSREHRFFTKSMRGRLLQADGFFTRPTRTPAVEPSDLPPVNEDWRLFQNNAPGECPCGTNKSVCKYH